MPTRHPRRQRIRNSLGVLRAGLERLLHRPAEIRPVRAERSFAPMVRSLEPRFVLNATAELVNDLLMVTGSPAVDTIDLEVGDNGVVIKDDGIPIDIIQNGVPLPSPLAFTEISAGIVFDTLGGNDQLNLQLPRGIDVSVLPSSGSDSTDIQYTMIGPEGARDITIATETIRVDSGIPHGRGNLTVGMPDSPARLVLQAGGLGVDGQFNLAGNVNVMFDGSDRLDLSMATVTANTPGLTLGVVGQDTTNVQIGGADGPDDRRLGDLKIDSVNDVTIGPMPLRIDGELSLNNVNGSVQLNSPVVAAHVDINSVGDVAINQSLQSLGAQGIRLASTTGSILVSGQLTSSSPDSQLAIRLFSGNSDPQQDSIRLEGALIQAEGLVQFAGQTTIEGDVRVESAGTIEFLDAMVSADQNADSLRLTGQTVRLRGDVGGVAGPDLNELFIDADLIVTRSLSVTGDVRLTAADTRLEGTEVRSGGSILFSSDVLLPVGNTNIMADEGVTFRRKVEGQTGSGDLNVMASRIAVETIIDTSRNLPDHVVRLKTNSGPIELGLIDAGEAVVDLQAATTIDNVMANASANVIARRLVMSAGDGIGNAAPLELARIAELRAVTNQGEIDLRLDATRPTVVENLQVRQVGNVRLQQRSDNADTAPIELRMVSTRDGSIDIVADGTIIATRVISGLGLDDSAADTPSRDITLRTNGAESDIIVTQISAWNSADVQLTAGDDILDSSLADDLRVVADDLDLLANNRSPDGDIAISLSTDVNDLQARVLGPARGDLKVSELNSITLASSDDIPLNEIVQTDNGQIVIDAADEIRVTDADAKAEGDDWTDDPEIIAGGDQGRIDFQADNRITLDDRVQLLAEKQTVRTPMEFIVQSPDEPPQSEIRMVVRRDDAAVYLRAGDDSDSGTVSFGEGIEINTGQNQGIARHFAPRPLNAQEMDAQEMDAGSDDMPTAFYDASQVRTNVLEQADVNNAVGILSLKIGQPGERGLTLNVDWGADTLRYQQIDGIPADTALFVPQLDLESDRTPLDGETRRVEIGSENELGGSGDISVAHKYTEADILFSDLNDRESETKPIEVRFSVRHHESIVVLGATVVQGGVDNLAAQLPEEQEPDQRVPPDIPITIGADLNRVISATDNDNPTVQDQNRNLTHNNGAASFFIPSLTIPVAFFPVRDVIPEFEKVELVVRKEEPLTTLQSTIEPSEASASAAFSRDEYFQIRAISPDPDAPRGEPVRLPAEVLNIDQLRRFLQGAEAEGIEGLPDGEYEIEYVLGDGNERTIFRFHLRDGIPTNPDDGLDEGILKLRALPDSEPQPGESNRDVEVLPPPRAEQIPPPPMPAADEVFNSTEVSDDAHADPNRGDESAIAVSASGGAAATMWLPVTARWRRTRRSDSAKRLSLSKRYAAKQDDRGEADQRSQSTLEARPAN